MFNFFKRPAPLKEDFSSLGKDMHSHILPGIDDGAPDVSTSISLIKAMMDLGYHTFYATPHVFREIHPNTPESIGNALLTLREALKSENLNVQVEAAAEYMLDEYFDEKITKKEFLTLPGNRVLVEMSTLSAPPQLDQTLFKLQLKGYIPLIAHPERYVFLKHNKKRYHEWAERGFELQVNLLSFTGYYGPTVLELAVYLLNNKLVHFAGSDLHHAKHLELIQKSLKNTQIQQLLKYEGLKNARL